MAILTLTDEDRLPHARTCFHCGEPVPAGSRHVVDVDGRPQSMCCPGCAAAAAAICGYGLSNYYRLRETDSPRPSSDTGAPPDQLSVYDDPAFQTRFASVTADRATVDLVVSGMSCAACAWLLESRLARVPGVAGFEVDFARRRAHVAWLPGRVKLSAILGTVEELGYRARPFTPALARELAESEAAALLRRVALAALFGMQVMMIALALYVGEASGMEPGHRTFLRWTSLVLTVPVIVYCAWPLLVSAARALHRATVNMDVPVALAVTLAFTGSAWHTVTGAGAVYFDSVVMFVALLLLSRFIELRARVAANRPLDAFAGLVPDSACVVSPGGGEAHFETVPAMRLEPGMVIRTRAGETFAADGVVLAGESAADESILTGESAPRAVRAGDTVLAGSLNVASPLRVEVRAVGTHSFAGQLAALVAGASHARPRIAEFGLRVARWFVGAVLVASLAAALFWMSRDPSRVFEVTLSVLVVSCPCALALAVPTALASAYARLMANGIAVLDAGALEKLARAREFVFDKTGTLTRGTLQVERVVPFGNHTETQVAAVAKALASESVHPVARALTRLPVDAASPVTDSREVGGGGVSARVAGTAAVLGSLEFVTRTCARPDATAAAPDDAKEAWVGIDGEVAGRIAFSDPPRTECGTLFAWLHASGCRTGVLSGDRASAVQRVVALCGAGYWEAGLTPAAKVARVAAMQRGGATVVMTGDGLNDAPVLAHADVSIAVADAVALSRQQADVLLLEPDLSAIRTLVEVARATRRVIRQNFAWALGYNLVALPLAFGGVLPPWGAALGMSVSSLAVVLNALRVRA